MLLAAAAAGVEHIDTAQFYGAGTVNQLIREALHPYPDDLAIVSKVGARRDAGGALLRPSGQVSTEEPVRGEAAGDGGAVQPAAIVTADTATAVNQLSRCCWRWTGRSVSRQSTGPGAPLSYTLAMTRV